jgi:hypothetical protein
VYNSWCSAAAERLLLRIAARLLLRIAARLLPRIVACSVLLLKHFARAALLLLQQAPSNDCISCISSTLRH